ncbi:MAG: tetratricopeptide repeat protein [Pseudomonadota bacterium]
MRFLQQVITTYLILWASTGAIASETNAPRPDLTGAAPLVAKALNAEADRLDKLLAAPTNDATLAEAWVTLGDAYFAHDYYAEALQAYAAASEHVSEPTLVAYRRGLAHTAEARPGEAIEFFTTVIAGPDDTLRALGLVRRGRALLDQGESEAALEDLKEAARRLPESPAALGALGRAQLAAGDAEAARQHLEQALRLEPAATRLRQPLGMAYRSLGNVDGARAALAGAGDGEPTLADPIVTSISMQSRSPQFFLQSGLAQADRGDFSAAAAMIGRAVALAPDDHKILSSYGQVLAEAGSYDLARKALTRVTAADTATADDWLYLAGVEQAEGRLGEAEAALNQVVALAPDNSRAKEALARITLHGGNLAAARKVFIDLAAAARDREERRRLNYWAGVTALAADDCVDALRHLDAARTGRPPYAAALLQALARARATCAGTSAEQLQEALAWSEEVYDSAPTLTTSATLAMAYAAAGRFNDAIDLQTQAIFEALKAGTLPRHPALQQDMARYREAQAAARAYLPEDPLFRLD